MGSLHVSLHKLATIGAVLLASVFEAGCSTHTLQLRYEPTMEVVPQTTETPRVAVGSFRDDRGEESTWFGAIRGGFGNPLKKLHANQPIVSVVTQAMSDALQARQMLASSDGASLRIDGSIARLDCNYYWNRDAHAHLLLNLVDVTSNAILFSQTYKTDNTEGGVGAGIFGDVDHLATFAQKALSETIDKALSDPALLASLRKKPTAAVSSSSSRLTELEDLHRRGLLTDAEYERKRKQILDGI
jgi:hypothetical protein